MNRISPATQQESDRPSENSELFQEFDEQLRAMQALGILLDSKLIDRSEYDRRAAIFGGE